MSRTYIAFNRSKNDCDNNDTNCDLDGSSTDSDFEDQTSSSTPYVFENFWRECKTARDFDILKHDLEQVKIFGTKNTITWLQPNSMVECSLLATDAYRCNDKDVTLQLEKRLFTDKNLARPRHSVWATFTFGVTNIGIISVYVLTRFNGPKCSMDNYRKKFFEKYVFKALRKIDKDAFDTLNPVCPSETSIYISPNIWDEFSKELNILLRNPPKNTYNVFFCLLIDNLKEDVEFSAKSLQKDIKNCVKISSQEILMSQIYFLCSLHISHQLISTNFDNINALFDDKNCILKNYFNLKRHGGFMAFSVKSPNCHGVTSVQFQHENNYLLEKIYQTGKCSLFANALLGDATEADLIKYLDLNNELFMHRENIFKLKDEIGLFVEGLKNGVIGRFQTTFTADRIHPELLADDDLINTEAVEISEENSIFYIFKQITEDVLKSGIIVKSTGNWWIKHCLKFQQKVLSPLIEQSLNLVMKKPLTQSILQEIYDRELIFILWSCANCKWVDKERLEFLKTSALENSNQELVTLSDGNELPCDLADQIISPSCINWFSKKCLKTFEYSTQFVNLLCFFVEYMPKDSESQELVKKHPFDFLLRLYNVYCTKFYEFDAISIGDKIAFSLEAFTLARSTKICAKYKRRPVVHKDVITTWNVLEALLHPSSLTGQVILIISMNAYNISKWRTEMNSVAQQIIRKNFQYFPSIFCDGMAKIEEIDDQTSPKNMYEWHLVDDETSLRNQKRSEIIQ